jgi:hypothetical protein
MWEAFGLRLCPLPEAQISANAGDGAAHLRFIPQLPGELFGKVLFIVAGLRLEHRKRLFDEQPDALLHAGPFENRTGAPLVSTPERALLEVLSEIGVRQPLQEARELVESTYSFRSDVLRELLRRCTSVKTVRLSLQLGRERSLPWVAKLDPAKLPTGSDRPWVSQSADGLLVLKP